MRTVTTTHARDSLRRAFIWNFMRADKRCCCHCCCQNHLRPLRPEAIATSDWASGFPFSVRLAGPSRIVVCRRLQHPLNYFCTRASFVAPNQHVGGNDLQDLWVVITLPEVHIVSDLEAQRAQQLCRDRYLANTGDLYRSTRHGHVHDLNKFNSLAVSKQLIDARQSGCLGGEDGVRS